MFDSFCLTDGTAVVGSEEIHKKKLIQLLAYLLVNRDSTITHQMLIDTFWGGDTKNPDVSLRNCIYQLRKILMAFGDETFIETFHGGYRWNPGIQVETDYERFEKKIHSLREQDITLDEQHQICEEILSGSGYQITEEVADEEWILGKKQYYEAAYLSTAKLLCSIWEEKEQWENLEILCRQIMDAGHEDEEIRSWMILSLYKQKKEELDPVQKADFQNGRHLKAIKNLLDEETETQGAYFCDFAVFKQLYRLEARRIERLGIAEYAVLFTLSRKGNSCKEENSSVLADGMCLLEDVIRRNLRSSDVAARYSATQFMILLPTCSYESSVRVSERILQAFLRSCGKKRLQISYEVAEITAGRE